jgi:hypothetical protein
MFPKYINLKRGAYIVRAIIGKERAEVKSLISDHGDGSTNVPMGSSLRRDSLHQRHGRLCYVSRAHLRSHGQRLPSRTKG